MITSAHEIGHNWGSQVHLIAYHVTHIDNRCHAARYRTSTDGYEPHGLHQPASGQLHHVPAGQRRITNKQRRVFAMQPNLHLEQHPGQDKRFVGSFFLIFLYSRNLLAECFSDATAVCGNGILEPGEICDCGQQCTAASCCTAQCTLNTAIGALCTTQASNNAGPCHHHLHLF